MISYDRVNVNYDDLDMGVIQEILKSGNVCKGKWNDKLSELIKDRFKVKYAIPCSSCTDGLIIAFKATNVVNKKVAIPAFTWGSTLYALQCSGNIPIFVDIHIRSFLIDYEPIEDKLDEIDAFIPVDIFGNNVGIHAIKQPVIIDAAHSFGIDNLGHRADVEVISLSYTKVVTGTQGGIILTNDDSIAEKCYTLVKDYAKLEEINAYIAYVSALNFDKNQEIRNRIIDKYISNLTIDYKLQHRFGNSNNSVFSIITSDWTQRNIIVKSLKDHDIGYKCYYEPLRYLPVTSHVYSNIICLPVYKEMEDKVEYICSVINNSLNKRYACGGISYKTPLPFIGE